MRIDYNEPRQSFGTPPTGGHGQRTSSGSIRRNLIGLLILVAIGFVAGFTSGWYLSQKATKRAFRAAMEQQSLESSPKALKKQPEQLQQSAQAQQQQLPSQNLTNQTAAQAPAQHPQQASPTNQVPLSFFENLPKGQKQTVLGSGINEKAKPAPASLPQTPKPSPPVSTKPVDAKMANTGYLVQIAAFNSAKEAENTRKNLAAKGYSASIVETNLNEKGTWYRVRIGRHLDKEAATEIASRIGGGAKVLPDQE
jgi:cell division protein FtsN